MKRIYITSLHMGHGGVEMAISLMANALVKRGYHVTILCTYNLGEPVYELDERVKIKYLTNVRPNKEEIKEALHKKKIFTLLKEGLYAVRVLYLKKRTMIQAIRKIKSGCIISTRNEHSVILSKYGNENVKKIAQLHHDHRFDKKLINDFKNNYGRVDYFVLLTDLLCKEVKRMMTGNQHTKCVVIPNFLDLTICKDKKEAKPQVIAVGRLHDVKRFHLLVEMWKDKELREMAHLLIVGDGEEKERLENLIKENHLESYVTLSGALEHDEVMEKMQESLVYAMTSETEAFPFVLIEAMSNGLPIVSYDVRVGPAAIIEDGKTGYLVTDNDRQDFIKKLKKLLSENDTRKQMSEEAIHQCVQYKEDAVMKKWMDIIED